MGAKPWVGRPPPHTQAPVLDQLSSPSAQCLHSPDPLGQALISMEPPKLLPLKLPTTSTHQENGNFSVLMSQQQINSLRHSLPGPGPSPGPRPHWPASASESAGSLWSLSYLFSPYTQSLHYLKYFLYEL